MRALEHDSERSREFFYNFWRHIKYEQHDQTVRKQTDPSKSNQIPELEQCNSSRGTLTMSRGKALLMILVIPFRFVILIFNGLDIDWHLHDGSSPATDTLIRIRQLWKLTCPTPVCYSKRSVQSARPTARAMDRLKTFEVVVLHSWGSLGLFLE